MAKYRKKPVEIEAVIWDGEATGKQEAPTWLTDAMHSGVIMTSGADGKGVQALIQTLEGDMLCNPGDYIIKGIKGELHPCKPDIFRATYEAPEMPTDPFASAAEPLMRYMGTIHPHHVAIVAVDRAELFEGQRCHVTDEFILD